MSCAYVGSAWDQAVFLQVLHGVKQQWWMILMFVCVHSGSTQNQALVDGIKHWWMLIMFACVHAGSTRDEALVDDYHVCLRARSFCMGSSGSG